MVTLSVDHFDAFHERVHGRGPFNWQSRLLRQIVVERRWPRVLDLPTGVGKTTCIDIALFALALDAERSPQEQWCPRRIAMVVDRRIVVDQAAERGRKLLRALVAMDHDDIVGEVARRLRSLCRETDEPVAVFTLRGGMPKDDAWARTPDQPLILASTVDQLGSRLLIQGYGVSRNMKPVHAGLLANDSLVLLDEVHLSQPFAETLDALQQLRAMFVARRAGNGSEPHLPGRFQHAFLSATPGRTSTTPFRLLDEERGLDTPLGPRLHASKPARLQKVNDRDLLCSTCAEIACDQIERHEVIAVVLNRVASAHRVAAVLRERLTDHAQVVLLTGRMRPLDRDEVLRELRPRIETGRTRSSIGSKLVVVGTQCIEAGADFDFDAIVTESASLDALRQRFGRVDRLGDYRKADGVIVHVDSKENKDDPVYGRAAAATFKWLEQVAKTRKPKAVDFGGMALPKLSAEEESELLAPRKSAPTLLPAYMDLWMQTSPPPSVAPDVALWLHGPESGPADVQVIWRCDLAEEDLSLEKGNEERTIAIVASVRPSSLEAVSVPFATARRWLAGEPVDLVDVADVEIARADVEQRQQASPGFRAVRWDGLDSKVIDARELRPGDTIVVPATYGGLRENTFDPSEKKDPVEDLAERAALFGRGRPALRLHPAVLSGLGLSLSTEDVGEARSALAKLAAASPPGWRKLWLQRLAQRGSMIVVDAENPWTVLEGRRVSPRELRDAARAEDARERSIDIATVEVGVELTTDEDDSFYAGRAVALSVHSGDVERFAREYASRVGFPPALAEDVALAGWLHDIGKADPRFQIMLRGGSEIDFLADQTPWAKSAIPSGAKAAQRAARFRSGYPKGARHEVQSLAMLEKHHDAIVAKANDLDLVLHLVASHHGHCRPFAPAVQDRDPVDVVLGGHLSDVFGTLDFGPTSSDHGLYRLDSSLADRFWRLVNRYGWLELCWLEAVLRLADHRASEMEQEGT